MKKILFWAAIAAALCCYSLGALFFASHTEIFRLYKSSGSASVSYERGTVLSIEKEELEADRDHGGILMGYQDVLVRIDSGQHAGTQMRVENVLNFTTRFLLRPGQRVALHVDVADASHYTVSIYSVDRIPALALLGILFIAALCGIGGRRGFRSLLGMVFTITSIVCVFIPLLYRGFSPIAAAMALSMATIAVSLLLLSGPNAKSGAAIVGSMAGIALAAVIAVIFTNLVQISGYTSAESDSLLAISGADGMKVGELLFASFVIASLGAEMDIAISIASAVWEVSEASPGSSRKSLFRAGMNVGRDMMGTMANTLILAFAGTALNSMILIYSIERSAVQLLNANTVTTEIVQSLVSGLALVVTVPAVAFFSALFMTRRAKVD